MVTLRCPSALTAAQGCPAVQLAERPELWELPSVLLSASSLLAPARVIVALARRHGEYSCAVIRRVLRAHAVRCCLARERRALPAAAVVDIQLHAVAALREAVAARRAQNAAQP